MRIVRTVRKYGVRVLVGNSIFATMIDDLFCYDNCILNSRESIVYSEAIGLAEYIKDKDEYGRARQFLLRESRKAYQAQIHKDLSEKIEDEMYISIIDELLSIELENKLRGKFGSVGEVG